MLGAGWEEVGSKLGGSWEQVGRKLGAGWEEFGSRLGGSWEQVLPKDYRKEVSKNYSNPSGCLRDSFGMTLGSVLMNCCEVSNIF